MTNPSEGGALRGTNPWYAAYRDGGRALLGSFVLLTIFFAGLNVLGAALARQYPSSPLRSRSTVLAGAFHAAATSAIAFYLLVFRGCGPTQDDDFHDKDGDDAHDCFAPWRSVAVPLSIAYFIADLYYYCLPRRDFLIAFHHVVMCLCHYPVCHVGGAVVGGAGDATWVTWLSAVGYTSELSTVLVNYRWYLLQTLEEDWIGFAITNGLVLVSWAARVVLFGYLLLVEILPRAGQYVREGQVLAYGIIVAGHAVIGALSLYWLCIMCRGGIKGHFSFRKKPSGERKEGGKAFDFGEDMGRAKESESESESKSSAGKKASRPICPPSPTKAVLDEARAYAEGTLFDADSAHGFKKDQ